MGPDLVYLMFNSRVLPFSILSDDNGVDIIIWCFVALDGPARSDVGEEVESSTKSEVK
jgi:hypothetical protein